MIKMNLKREKSGFISARGHVYAMWHARPRGSATRAHAAPTRRVFIFIFYIVYNIICSAFHLSEGNINPLKTLLIINPIAFLNFSRVGLSPTHSLKCR